MGLRRIVCLTALLCASAAQSVYASSAHEGNACQMIPPNNQFYGVGFTGGITEATFNAVIDQAEKVYGPVFAAKGATLQVERNWADGTVNAYAEQIGTTWKVSMFGGLARHPETTPDAFAEVICHEIGHHIGGAPKYSGMSWASVEGQSDYFATLKCMHKMIDGLQEWPTLALNFDIDPLVAERCQAAYPGNDKEINICVRSSYGGLALARLLASLGGDAQPNFNTPDTSKVTRTNENHPAGQCRLDTYFAGAVCAMDPNIEPSGEDTNVGSCVTVATPSPLMSDLGVRPGCWFSDKAVPAPDEGSDDDWWPWPWPEEMASN